MQLIQPYQNQLSADDLHLLSNIPQHYLSDWAALTKYLYANSLDSLAKQLYDLQQSEATKQQQSPTPKHLNTGISLPPLVFLSSIALPELYYHGDVIVYGKADVDDLNVRRLTEYPYLAHYQNDPDTVPIKLNRYNTDSFLNHQRQQYTVLQSILENSLTYMAPCHPSFDIDNYYHSHEYFMQHQPKATELLTQVSLCYKEGMNGQWYIVLMVVPPKTSLKPKLWITFMPYVPVGLDKPFLEDNLAIPITHLEYKKDRLAAHKEWVIQYNTRVISFYDNLWSRVDAEAIRQTEDGLYLGAVLYDEWILLPDSLLNFDINTPTNGYIKLPISTLAAVVLGY